MDFKRIALYVALGVTSLMIWDAWHKDYPTGLPVAKVVQQENKNENGVPDVSQTKLPQASPPASSSSSETETSRCSLE